MKAFTVNVGINTSADCLGRSAPIYANGTFDYIPIPSDNEQDSTYDELGLTSAFERLNILHRIDDYTHHDPEFVSFTYGDFPTKSRTSNLKDIERGDLILFIASLKRTKHERLGSSFQKWILPNRGMYLIGMFEVIGILTNDGERFRKKLGGTKFKKSPHYRRLEENKDDASWIFKGSNRSCLFPVAVPIRHSDLAKLYGIKPAKTNQTETAQINSYTRTAREIIDIDYLTEMVHKLNTSIEIFREKKFH
ncbi:MAG: hypothetical protein ACTSR9_14155 [Candidatus Thorarchaeota archaeon]